MLPFVWTTAWLVLFCSVRSSRQQGVSSGGSTTPISCECTTANCRDRRTSVCRTRGLCFTQYTETPHPLLLRGCTEGRSPLLCENRPPHTAKHWPLLHCCNTDFCNRDKVLLMPTPAPHGGGEGKFSAEMRDGGSPFEALEVTRSNRSDPHQGAPQASSSLTSAPQENKGRGFRWLRLFGPVQVSVVVLGLVSMFIVSIVAAIVIRRSNERFRAERHRYGALEFQRGKEVEPPAEDYDSEVESIASSQPYLQIPRPNG